jgi:hypothetical protein
MPTNPHPGDNYYVQPTTGTIQRQSNPVAVLALKAAGFQGPMTWEQAQGVIALNSKARGAGVPAAGAPAASFSNPIADWMKSLGGSIASGLEAGVVAFFQDLWDVIQGPVEVIAGVILAGIVIGYAFKNDLMALAPLAAAMI